ncbi:hypothetical protein GmHk_08G022058 [Glycine max]|nr:hypothetical protein GmHk_08G022058 [Glycine max]
MPKNPDPLSSRFRLVAGSQLLGSFLSRRRRPRSVVRRPSSGVPKMRCSVAYGISIILTALRGNVNNTCR